MDITDKECIRVRNEELFPFVKDNTTVIQSDVLEQNDDKEEQKEHQSQPVICISFINALQFIALIARVVPELLEVIPELNDCEQLQNLLFTKIKWHNIYQSPEDEANDSNYTTFIRKKNFKMYKYDTRCKNLDKVFAQCTEDYLDPLDRQMLVKRHKQMNYTSMPAQKWLNMCWDSFRHVDNHNKSHMFQSKLPRPGMSKTKAGRTGKSGKIRE